MGWPKGSTGLKCQKFKSKRAHHTITSGNEACARATSITNIAS
jgi:hypothetical protein